MAKYADGVDHTPIRRHTLAPGLHAIRTGRSHWQFGMLPVPTLVARDPQTDAAVEALIHDGDTLDPRVAALLEDHGVLIDPIPLLRSRAAQRGAVAALARQFPHDYPHRWQQRACLDVAVIGDLGVDVLALLQESGFDRAVKVDAAPDARSHDLVLFLSTGEPPRDHVLPLVRSGTPHLLGRVIDGVPVLGPLTEPGQTACLFCIDQHREDEHPGSRDRLLRYIQATQEPHVRSVPDPADPTLLRLMTSWLVRDIATYADGGEPSSWSTTHLLAPDLTWLQSVSWLRHPQCGCNWV